MPKYDLSVLIPARNEMFLQNTIDDVRKNIRADTEIIVVLDGYLPDKGIPGQPNLTVIQRPESIGQRAATNEAARVSHSPYILKLDAHCSVGEGFDRILLDSAKELGETVLQVPGQFNLHAFVWVCPDGHERYQSRSGPCRECKKPTERKVVWRRRKSTYTTAWRFDKGLKFDYWGAFKSRPEGKGPYSETMSLLGACWFTNREHYWRLDGLDEDHGSWGQMGTELACMYWLSGGRVICNHKTWFAHMFRTRGGDFGFPYPIKHHHTEKARKYSREKWQGNKWSKAKRKFQWIIDHFAPVPGWEGGDAVEAGSSDRPTVVSEPRPVASSDTGRGSVTKGIVYYSDCRGDPTILNTVRAQLARAANTHTIVSSCLDVVPLGETRIVHAKMDRGYLTMFKQILAGLELSDADVIFLAEHDILYHPSHFDFIPPSDQLIYYNQNTWKVDAETGRALHYLCKQTSGLCAYRNLLLEHYRKRVALVEERGFTRKMGFEPGTHSRPERVDDLKSEVWMSPVPNIDIRHSHNLTQSRWRQDQFRDKRSCQGWTEADEVPGWGRTKGRFAEFLKEAVS